MDPERRALRRQQLIDAALHCIATLGLRDTTVQDLAAFAHMAVGSINQYFATKEALYTAALRSLADEFEAAWQQKLAAAPADPAPRLRAFVDVYFDAAICQPRKVAVWFAYWGEARARPQYRQVCAATDRRHDAALEQLVRAVLIREGRAEEDAAGLARLIAASCHGLWLYFLSAADRPRRRDLQALARAQLASLFASQAHAFAGP